MKLYNHLLIKAHFPINKHREEYYLVIFIYIHLNDKCY